MPRSLKLLPLLGLALLMASCMSSPKPAVQLTPALTSQSARSTSPSSASSPTTSVISDPLCASVHIVKLSSHDTTETIAAVIANNAAIRAVCHPAG